MTLPIVIIGGGGHATVLAETARASGLVVAGYTAPKSSEWVIGLYLGQDSQLEDHHAPGTVDLLIGVGSVAPTRQRSTIYKMFSDRGYGFATLVHPTAVVSVSARLGSGAQILAGCVVQTGAVIADNAILNTRASVDHHSVVGAHTHVAPGAVLCGGVVVGECAHIGAGAVLIQNSKVPNDGFVRAGEVFNHA